MKGFVVIDASLAAMWGIPESFTDSALSLARQWAREKIQPIAPSLILPEITNAFYKRVTRREIDLSAAIGALHIVLDFGIEIREEPGLHAWAMELAHKLKRPNTYDCHYLALSEIHHCPLWTGDERFYNAAGNYFPQLNWVGRYALPPSGRTNM
jgi:predicted nucleic acid-binding protein